MRQFRRVLFAKFFFGMGFVFEKLLEALWSCLGRLLGCLGALLGGLVFQKHGGKHSETHIFETCVLVIFALLERFWGLSWLIRRLWTPKWGPKFVKMWSKKWSICGDLLAKFWDHFLGDFGG